MKKLIMLVLITLITSSLMSGCRCCGSHGDPKPEHPKEHPVK